ncbi:MAG: DUF488 family protein [Methanomicrobiales archaeon]|nr:DUF488 family protein [Methanomicrobiales archaeon]
MAIEVKRVYSPPSKDDGYRILVERLWPRGVSKERAQIDLWLKEAGASPSLRTWFGHQPEKWAEFRNRYFDEIRQRPDVVKILKEIIQAKGTVTFVFAARDEVHNNAVALKEFLEEENMS